jgi:protein AATF/BFR2
MRSKSARLSDELDPLARAETSAKAFGAELDGFQNLPIESETSHGDHVQRRRGGRARLPFKSSAVDPALQQGRYAAQRRRRDDEGGAGTEGGLAQIDALFDALEADSDDEGAQNLQTEEQFTKWQEEKIDQAAKRHKVDVGGRTETEISTQIRELVKRVAVRGEVAPAIQEEPDRDDTANDCVAAYQKLLQLRMALQKSLRLSYGLPVPSVVQFLAANHSGLRAAQGRASERIRAVGGELEKLAGLQMNFESADLKAIWSRLDSHHGVLLGKVAAVVDGFSSGAALKESEGGGGAHVPDSQIDRAVEANQVKLRLRSQQYFSSLLPSFPLVVRGLNPDLWKTENYTDADFLKELVQKSGRVGDGGAVADFLEAEEADVRLVKPSREGFHKLTKGKALTFDPRPKLVGFMAPAPYPAGQEEGVTVYETLIESLFQSH